MEQCDGLTSIWDLLGRSDDDATALLDQLADAMRARGSFALSTYGVGAHIGAVLLACGFRKREAAKSLVVDCSPGLPAAQRDALLDPSSWYVVNGGEDC